MPRRALRTAIVEVALRRGAGRADGLDAIGQARSAALLDRVAEGVRESLGLRAEQLPLCKVLEGGTWAAGREAAKEKRRYGSPPIRVESDGTVF